MRRNAPTLAMMMAILTAGFALSLTFFVGSTSVIVGLDDFFASHHLQRGAFTLLPEQKPPRDHGIEAQRAADVDALGGRATVRVLEPRHGLNLHEVVAGRDLRSPDEILLSKRFAEEHAIRPGDTVRVRDHAFEVAGFFTVPEYVSVKSTQFVLQPNHQSFGLAMVSHTDFDAVFRSVAHTSFAYDETHTANELVGRYGPVGLLPTSDDSRVQVAVTDAQGPRDLAFLVFVLFLAITGALLAVYHLRTRTADEFNNSVIRQAGLAGGLHRHQKTETRLLLVLSWLLSYGVGMLLVRSVMGINAELYDYPKISVLWWLLALCALGGLASCLALNELTYWIANRSPAARQGHAAPRWRGVSLHTLRVLPDVGHRYKVVRMLRRPSEVVSIFVLVLVVGLFTTFALNLKWSVEDYVASLAKTTPYERLYDVGSMRETTSPKSFQERAGVTTLYAFGAPQSIFRVPKDSSFVGDVPGPTVTRAFADKYGVRLGDDIRLSDVTGSPVASVQVEHIREADTASALMYFPEESWGDDLPSATRFSPVVMSAKADHRLEGQVPALSRAGVRDSGESIVHIINVQVTLLLVLAAALLVTLFTTIVAFTISTQSQAREVMVREGISPRSIRRSLFGGYALLTVASVAVAGLLGAVVVRVFLDGIMGRFVNFVHVTATGQSTLVALVCVAALMQICIRFAEGRTSRATTSAPSSEPRE